MKLLLIIISQFVFINSFAQNLDKADVNDFKINDLPFIFSVKNVFDFEKNVGKLMLKQVDEYEKVPFIRKRPDKIFRNDNVLLYVKKDKAYIGFVDLEKNNWILKYKTNTLSYSSTRDDFKKIFPNSYKSPSYMPGVLPENAVGYSVTICENNKKAYLNFTFYHDHLTSIAISEKQIKITD
ncbi:hypothetical protein NG800_018105 [Epilithonimonas ginsengisoli]|uniref:Uncharacterized protein n=1 Tax=Epilithonimonas ginsengisoli TaxID=1245592 RepID=A0ABU4JMX5_9FLAO|nr:MULTISPECIES: hypothetical protein [Chryseobacterium group]MBV6881790.1 hypothetical protein [Epilithonimonas sp. FP105]MDW8550846.1 hypothetical protein [Epilithonimonas ginsengisoli]OAH68520.1 hypothetical protein AXA65_17075 [Chryseobacterium sp. FP211-J200]